ncbi:MAG: lipoyl(octanoyl) transferase [Candidatus Melainabacteria bacterium GWF2_37_15]|nr:MAG: lipoyl(octanoyl) transferase [Candidatus Melainabacteria bacterium GWF2_37_15]
MWIIEQLGIIEYQQAFSYQEHLVKLKQEGEKRNFFLLLQHYPVFTRGKGAKLDNILDKNVPVHVINRGGDLTYHEPGQLVGYIIMDLRSEKLDIRKFITKIENLIVNTLQKLNIPAYRDPDIVGVWLEGKKIASIGIAIRKGITMHGFALNINNELAGFKKINPCGLNAEVMSSLQKVMGQDISFDTVQEAIIQEFNNLFTGQI